MLTQLLMFCAFANASVSDRALALETDASPIGIAENARFGCTQPIADQAAIIREAEANDYTLRRLEFVGNERISDGVLRKRLQAIQEGDRFRSSNLLRGLANVSRLKTVYPVQLSDVVLRLEASDKLVDIRICFREKRLAKK